MTLSHALRTLSRRWHLALPAIAVSCVLAGLTFTVVPVHYTSTGLVMVVQPKRPGTLKESNPLLSFETSLNTTAVMLSQSLNAPRSAAILGVTDGPDKYTVKNVGDTNTGGDPNQPFLYVTAQGSTPQASADLVEAVLTLARQQLADQQRSLRVTRQDALSLVTIAGASTPKLAPGLSLAASAGVLGLGIALTVLVCTALERRARAREQVRRLAGHVLVPDPLSALALEYGQAQLTTGPIRIPDSRSIGR